MLEDKLKPKYVTTVVICLSLSNTIANWEEGGREGGYDQELCPSGDRVQGQDQPAPGGPRQEVEAEDGIWREMRSGEVESSGGKLGR